MSSLKTKLPQAGRAHGPESCTETNSVSPTDSGGDRRVTRRSNHIKTYNIVSYNVRTLSSQDKLIELENELENIRWDIVGLSEIRRQGEKLITLQSGHIFYHINNANSWIGGIGFLINKRHTKNIVSVKSISERVAYVIINLNQRYKMKVIQAYAPTTGHEDEEVEDFYEQIEEALTQTYCHYTFITGDFNAKVGKQVDTSESAIGKFCLDGRNERGQMLIDFVHQHGLHIMNSFFKKKTHRRWTWASPDMKTKNEIDFLITERKENVTDVTVLNRFGVGSDHRALRGKIKIDLRREREKLIRKVNPRKWQLPEDTTKYEEFIASKLPPQPINDVEILNNTIEEVLKMAQKHYCKQPKSKEDKLSRYTRELMEERRRRRGHGNGSDETMRDLNKKISKEIRKDLRKHNREQIQQTIEENKNMKVLRKRMKEGRIEIFKLKDNLGHETTDRKKILEITKAFYSELYKSSIQNTSEEIERTGKHKLVNVGSELIPEITIDEVTNALKEMKNNKAPGEDQIVIEAIKFSGKEFVKVITSLFNLCLEKGILPSKWNNAITIIMHKKGDITNLENYRPISLLSHLYKLFMKVITKRIENKLDFYQSREQAGFRRGFGTNDHLQTIKTLIEKTIEYNRPLVLTFVDFRKAFDTVEFPAIFKSLQQCRIDYRYTRLIQHIYKNATANIKLHENTEIYKINRGIRQGDTISPKLFTAVLEYAFKNLTWEDRGINIDGEYLSHLCFADDIVLISDNLGEARQMLIDLKEVTKSVGLSINFQKTMFMTNMVASDSLKIGGGAEVIQTYEYKYLGHEIKIGRDNQTCEIHRRIGLGWAAFGKLRDIFKEDLPMCLKRKVYDQCVLPVITYGAETITLTKGSANKLRVAQRKMERAMTGVTRRDKIRNTALRDRTGVTDVIQKVTSAKWKWAGHVARMTDNRWTKRLIIWRPREDRRSRGRPPTRWSDDMKKIAGNWVKTAQDRRMWLELEEAYVQQWTTSG